MEKCEISMLCNNMVLMPVAALMFLAVIILNFLSFFGQLFSEQFLFIHLFLTFHLLLCQLFFLLKF